jgi:hypothetical protein
VACWLESLSCEVVEPAARDVSFLAMHLKARTASSLSLIKTFKSSKVVSNSGQSEAGGWSANGAKKLETRR